MMAAYETLVLASCRDSFEPTGLRPQPEAGRMTVPRAAMLRVARLPGSRCRRAEAGTDGDRFRA